MCCPDNVVLLTHSSGFETVTLVALSAEPLTLKLVCSGGKSVSEKIFNDLEGRDTLEETTGASVALVVLSKSLVTDGKKLLCQASRDGVTA